MPKHISKSEPWEKGSLLANGDNPNSVTHLGAENFISWIHDERQAGYGFVPFVGAGFSAPSGAPLIWDFKSYLQRCICMAFGLEDRRMEAWDPRTDQWPPFIDRDRPEPEAEFWSNRLFNELINRRNVNSRDPELPILAEGAGAAAEWRTSLLFLSRLVRPARGTSPHRRQPLRLGAPRQEIIDSCFREVLKEKYPALGHKMLAVLAGALRLDLVLTTNFDDLLERAFAAARNPLEVFEVPLGGDLPHWSALSDVRALLKLHGNHSSLRADYSLDELPSEVDKQRFLEYLLSGVGRSRFRSDIIADWKPANLDFQNHLLVMGVSCNDRRTLEFIKYAWLHLNGDFRVFWLCYSKEDVDSVKRFTKEIFERFERRRAEEHKASAEPWKGSVILRHTHFGLFLLQLYQSIRKNLPPFGSLFPSVSRLTLPPLPPSDAPTQSATDTPDLKAGFTDEIKRHLKEVQSPTFSEHKLVVVSSEGDVGGVSYACGDVFRDLEDDNVCLWIDMNDISSADNLFEVLLEAAYFRLGLENWTPVYVARDARPRAAEIKRLVDSVNKPWVIFLNARETPGANTTAGPLSPNGWLDQLPPSHLPDDSDNVNSFLELLVELCGPNSPRISVVLLCRDLKQQPELITQLKESGLLRAHVALPSPKDPAQKLKFAEMRIVTDAILWTKHDPQKQRFLHALVLMQRQRLLATIWSPALSLTRYLEEGEVDERPQWVNELERLGLVRRKAGGFIWIHSRCRESIRFILRNPERPSDLDEMFLPTGVNKVGWDPKTEVPTIHTALAEWYTKVLDASEAPAAVFETIYHLCRAAEGYLALRIPEEERACERVEAASALLKTESFLIQTHGYSRGSCRRLDHIRDVLIHDVLVACFGKAAPPPLVANMTPTQRRLIAAAQRLRVVCTEVMRAIAREVGEDGKAYVRHSQFGIFLSGADWRNWEEMRTDGRTPDFDQGHYVISNKILLKLRGEDPNSSLPEIPGVTPVDAWDYVKSPATQWLRWWRWSGMLGIASRSYHAAERSLRIALQCCTGNFEMPPKTDIEWDQIMRGEFVVLGKPVEAPQRQEVSIEILRIIEQYVELLLLKESAESRLKGIEIVNHGDPQALQLNTNDDIKWIETVIAYGRKLVADIRGRDHSADSRYTISANWCECRLLMHSSVCAARRVQLDFDSKGRDPQNAMGLLGDAEASLRVSEPRRYRAELAMVELHRAEARLREAESVGIQRLDQPPSSSFAEMCRFLELRKPDTQWWQTGKQLREKMRGRDGGAQAVAMDSDLRRARSLVSDSIRFLKRAEPVLRDRRRNVWWTTWFFERRLRSIALSVWASAFEKGTPIPFLGLEAAMRKTATEADLLLEDAIRMIRVDTYRMATIIDAYASCAKALQIRLMLERECTLLPERQARMHLSLVKALTELDRVQDLRQGAEQAKRHTNNQMDPTVSAYVNKVRERCKTIAEHIKEPF